MVPPMQKPTMPTGPADASSLIAASVSRIIASQSGLATKVRAFSISGGV